MYLTKENEPCQKRSNPINQITPTHPPSQFSVSVISFSLLNLMQLNPISLNKIFGQTGCLYIVSNISPPYVYCLKEMGGGIKKNLS